MSFLDSKCLQLARHFLYTFIHRIVLLKTRTQLLFYLVSIACELQTLTYRKLYNKIRVRSFSCSQSIAMFTSKC